MNDLQRPALSVLITTYNRSEILRRTLKAWLDQTFKDFELIVIDDGSTDSTWEVLNDYKSRYRAQLGDRLVIHRQENKGASAARNLGINLARGDVIVFIDDDAYPVPIFLESHYRWHQRYPNAIVRGPIINISSWDEVTPAPPKGFLNRLRHYSKNFFCTANVSIAKRYILEVGGFDESFKRWEDTELAYKLRASFRFKWIFDYDATVYHYKPQLEEVDESFFYREGIYSAKLFLKYSDNIRVKLRTGYFFPNLLLWRLLLSKSGEPLVKRFKKLSYLRGYVRGFMDTLNESRKREKVG